MKIEIMVKLILITHLPIILKVPEEKENIFDISVKNIFLN